MGVLDDTSYQMRSPEWPLGGTEERNTCGPMNANPGPGAYGGDAVNEHCGSISGHGHGYTFPAEARIGDEVASRTPGPGSYEPHINAAISSQGQGYSFGASARICDGISSSAPGPGAYAPYYDSSISGQGQGYTFGGASRIADMSAAAGPGPGACTLPCYSNSQTCIR